MNLAVDARLMYRPGVRGVGKATISLYREILRLRPEWRLLMLHRGEPGGRDPFPDQPLVRDAALRFGASAPQFWRSVRLPLAARAGHADLLHCPSNVGPIWPILPMVVTVHDLIPLERDFVGPGSRRWGREVARSINRARLVIVPSHYTKRELVDRMAVPPAKIKVIHWAGNPNCHPAVDVAAVEAMRSKYGLAQGQPYVLHLGGEHPRKNTVSLMRAWAALPDKLREQYALLIIGVQESVLPRFRHHALDLGISASCWVHGYVEEPDFVDLLGGAVVLAYPSRSEGFGLPILDAFASNTTVLTSDCTSMPEIAGPAAVLVNPRRVDSITHGLAHMLRSERLRLQLIQRGRARLRKFSWEACARRTARVLEEAAG